MSALRRLRRAPILAAMYPVVVLLGQTSFSAWLGKTTATALVILSP
ncbi:MAG: hypothetical protein ABGW81_01755 [Paracoccaceae bacterium]